MVKMKIEDFQHLVDRFFMPVIHPRTHEAHQHAKTHALEIPVLDWIADDAVIKAALDPIAKTGNRPRDQEGLPDFIEQVQQLQLAGPVGKEMADHRQIEGVLVFGNAFEQLVEAAVQLPFQDIGWIVKEAVKRAAGNTGGLLQVGYGNLFECFGFQTQFKPLEKTGSRAQSPPVFWNMIHVMRLPSLHVWHAFGQFWKDHNAQ